MHRVLGSAGSTRPLADPNDVANEALDHLAEGPIWIFGADQPTGGSPLGAVSRRDAVVMMSSGKVSARKWPCRLVRHESNFSAGGQLCCRIDGVGHQYTHHRVAPGGGMVGEEDDRLPAGRYLYRSEGHRF